MGVNPEILRDKSNVKQVVVSADEDEEITLLLELYILVGMKRAQWGKLTFALKQLPCDWVIGSPRLDVLPLQPQVGNT